jgi:hypothetical protein
MSPSAESTTSAEVQIRKLVARGFRFIDPRDNDGEVIALIGVRAHDNVVDVVQLHSEDDAVATRVPGDEDALAPATVLWRHAGPARDVLSELLALPDDRVPGSVAVAR